MKQLKDGDIDEITLKINTRPRKELNFTTPIEEYLAQRILSVAGGSVKLSKDHHATIEEERAQRILSVAGAA
ncbi:MAG: hypothetical protein II791_04740 [Bacteroidales bacterium]|nr:hypothetical protein [Bacteroidales bacterium]